MKKIALSIVALTLTSAFVILDPGNPISQLHQRIDTYNKKYHRNKLDLFFNQSKYSPGDTALLRTLYLTASDLKPVQGRQIVYIELFDQKGARVFRNQILVVNGFASNALVIPKEVNPGIYLVVAYSDWMRNLDPSLFFKQQFFVTGKELLKEVTPNGSDTHLNFYPEGGTLISGIENNLVVEMIGDIKNAKAIIRGGAEGIPALTFDSEGLAEVKITPQQNAHYTIEILVEGQLKKFDLPPSKPDGFSIETKQSQTTNLISVKLIPAGNLDWTKKYFLVFTSCSGIVYSRLLDFSKKELTEVSLPNDLPSGIAQITLVDENLKVWLQRVIAIKSRSDFNVKVTQSKKLYATREPVKIEVEVVDRAGNPVQGHFTMSITNQDLFRDSILTSASDNNLSLYSDISATRKLNSAAKLETLDRYLITQTCPWLNWDQMALANNATPRYLPQSSIAITGRAISLETGQPVPDSTTIMFFLQKQIFGYEIMTTPTGTFTCPILFDFAGTDEVFYAASNRGKDLYNIGMQLEKQDSVYAFKASPWVNTQKEDSYGIYQVQKKIVDQSFSFFSKDKQRSDSISDPNAAIEDELQGADMVLSVNDFILFPTMEDLIREVLRSVDYRKIRGRDVIRIYTTHKRPTNFAGPLYVIDGVLTKNPSTFLNLKPSEIITIKVVKDGSKLAKFGTLGTNGVILVRTKNSDRKPGIRQDNTFELIGMTPKYKALENESTAPVQAAAPIIKSCLFWAPDQILDVNGRTSIHFTTSDDAGNFRVHLEGLTAEGKTFFAEETFQVKYSSP